MYAYIVRAEMIPLAKLPKQWGARWSILGQDIVISWCMKVEILFTQDQVLICPLVIILSLSKTASTPWPPALLCKQEEAGRPWTHIYAHIQTIPQFFLCVQCGITVVGSHLHWRVSVLGQNQTEHVPWKLRGVRPSLCTTASLRLQPAHPLNSPRLHPCYLPSHPSPLLHLVVFSRVHFTVSIASPTP